jgi:nucleotide-binding universal stress UspA family protein
MVEERTLVVAVEDSLTATIVAVEAAHVAIADGASKLVLLHVLDQRSLSGAAVAMSGYYIPIAETPEEGETLLSLAEHVIRTECEAMGKPVPAIEHVTVQGSPGASIEQVVKEYGAQGLVLGARRPHAFGRLTHPNVRQYLTGHTDVRIHVASLEAPDNE